MGLTLGHQAKLARFHLVRSKPEDERAALETDVREGLSATPKRLSCRFFYDAHGSRLFDAICELPEYYPTRCERQILQTHARHIAGRFSECQSIVELGSGSATKTRLLLQAFARGRKRLTFLPIDISEAPLQESSDRLLKEFPALSITAIAGEYQEGISRLNGYARSPRLIVWLGSSIGNFDPDTAAAFLSNLVSKVDPCDRFLIGIDLRKDKQTLERAYDDSQKVTAEFNMNLLRRVNRQLGSDFDLSQFEHLAIYNEELGRVEMHLRSRCHQAVTISKLGMNVQFAAGETIHTENSYKFSLNQIQDLGARAGLKLTDQWFDDQKRFSVNLFETANPGISSVGCAD